MNLLIYMYYYSKNCLLYCLCDLFHNEMKFNFPSHLI